MSLKRHKTQQQETSDTKTAQKRFELLERMIEVASYQKLLPKFVYEMDSKCAQGRKKRFLEYQKIVKNLYGEEGKSPLKYDPQEAMTEREKLRRKIAKLQNHELQIDYFERVKTKNGNPVPTFKPSHLQKVNLPTKKEFLIFGDFNQKKFLKSYTQIFDDKLQLRQTSLFRKQRVKTVASIPENQHEDATKLIPNPKFNQYQLDKLKEKQNGLKKKKNVKLMPLNENVAAQQTVNLVPLKQANPKYKPHIERIKIGKMLNDIQVSVIYQKMLKIGSFPASVSQNSLSLTKESLVKYLKLLYERQVRIIDFLQVKPAFSLEQYMALCTKLKLMQVEHIIFMTFMSYDFNNDGYICENDIKRLKSLVETRRNKVLQHDLKLIEGIKQKRQYEAKVLFHQDMSRLEQMTNHDSGAWNYLELYKLPEVTESTYFNWLKRQTEKRNSLSSQKVNNLSSQKVNYKEQQHQKNDFKDEKVETQQKNKKGKINPFNPSVLKFKFSYFQQKADVRKYIMGIKSTKIYIGFEEFKSKYEQKQQNRHYTRSVQSRAIHSSKVTKQVSKNDASTESSRFNPSRSQLKVDLGKRDFKFQYQESIHRPYLWYDLMDKLTGVRYEGLKYD